jgi:hypothetical protein
MGWSLVQRNPTVCLYVWSRNPEKGGQRSILDYKRLRMNLQLTNSVRHLSHECCMSHSWLHYPNNMWWKLEIMKHLITQFLPSTCHCTRTSVRSKCSHHLPVLKYLVSMCAHFVDAFILLYPFLHAVSTSWTLMPIFIIYWCPSYSTVFKYTALTQR